MKLFAPKCDNCGARLYPTDIPSRWKILGTIPSYCPVCGNELSNTKRAQIDSVQSNFICIVFSTMLIIIIVVVVLSYL